MFANYLIGLREGLEASLVVGILIAYVVKTGNRHRLGAIWAGTALAILASLAFGGILTLTSHSLSEEAEHVFAGTMSILAVALVTWMVFWMRRTAREMRGELHGRLDKALSTGGFALAVVALVAVLREGLETALFLWAATSASEGTAAYATCRRAACSPAVTTSPSTSAGPSTRTGPSVPCSAASSTSTR